MLVQRNVSINAMNEYNQTAMHFACQNGYFEIANYLISINCNVNLVDNYGNAPIHYALDKFVYECSKNELYKDENKKLKILDSTKFRTAENIVKNMFFKVLIGEYKDWIKSATNFKKFFKRLIEQNSEFNETIIEEQKENIIKRIEELYKNINKPSDNDILKIINESKDFFTKLYDNYKINDLSITNYDLIIDEFINNAEEKRKKIFKKYESELKIINDTHLESIITEIKNIVTDYYININAPYYYALYLKNKVIPTAKKKNKSIVADLGSLEKKINDDFIKKLPDISIEFKYYNFSVKKHVTLDKDNFEIDDDIKTSSESMDYDKYNKTDNNNDKYVNLDIYYMVVLIYKYIDIIKNELSKFINIDDNIKLLKFILYCSQLIYEYVFNLINNLMLLTDQLNEIKNLDEHQQNFESIIDNVNELTSKDQNLEKYLDMGIEINSKFEESIKKIKDKEYINTNNKIYEYLYNIINSICNIVEIVNELISNTYYSKYLEYLKKNLASQEIDNFFTKKFLFKNILPQTFNEYIIKYGNDIKKETPATNNTNNTIKNDTLKKLFINIKEFKFNSEYDFYKKKNKNDRRIEHDIIEIDNNSKNKIEKKKISNNAKDILSISDDSSKSITYDIKHMLYNSENHFMYTQEKGKYTIDTSLEIPSICLYDIQELITISIIYFFNRINNKIVNNDKKKLSDFINNILTEINESEQLNSTQKKMYNETLINIEKSDELTEELFSNFFLTLINTNLEIMVNFNINKQIKEMIDLISNKYSLKIKNNEINTEDNDDLENLNNTKMLQEIFKKNKEADFLDILNADSIILQSGIITSGNDEKKLILNKCYSEKKIDKFISVNNLDIKIEDLNGNNIINRLIDQYNIYGIKKILEQPRLKLLKTFKNSKLQTPKDYVLEAIKNVQNTYNFDIFNNRIEKYAEDLQNILTTNPNFGELLLDTEQKLVQNLILNSIYLFCECLWLKMYDMIGELTITDITNIKEIIKKYKNITIEEQLLINTFDNNDAIKLLNSFINNDLEESIKSSIQELEEKNNKLDKKNKELDEVKKNKNTLMSNSDIDKVITKNTSKITENNKKIKDLNDFLTNNKSTIGKKLDAKIKIIKTKFSKTDLIINYNIDFEKYQLLVKDDLTTFYSKIIKLLNDKNKINNIGICNFNLLLFNIDYSKFNTNEIKAISNYYNFIINNIYADFSDFDLYEDSEYNYVNQYMINIIKVNTQSILIYEMLNALINYGLEEIKDTATKEEVIESLNPENSDYKILYDISETLMKIVLYEKLQIKNPEIKYEEVDILKDNLLKAFTRILNIPENENYEKIINFYIFIYENIAHNTYEELIKLLTESKKISIYSEILTILNSP